MENKVDLKSLESASPSKDNQFKLLFIGIAVVLGISLSYVGATQYSESSLKSVPGVYDPYFLTWFSTCWMIICYPLYFIISPILLRFKILPHKNLKDVAHESTLIFGQNGLTAKSLALKITPFLILWTIANYAYSQALGHISAGETTSIFGSCSAFVYILSLIVLGDKFTIIRFVAVLISITGIAIMPLGTGFGVTNAVGIISAMFSSASAATYKVLFKKVIGNASLGQVSLFMSLLGVVNLLLNWIIVVILIETDVEKIIWTELPWSYMCSSAALNLIYNFLINLGIAITHPLFISVGLFLGIPFNSVVDIIMRNIYMNTFEWIGTGCILISFLLMLLPENCAENVRNWLRNRKMNTFDVNKP